MFELGDVAPHGRPADCCASSARMSREVVSRKTSVLLQVFMSQLARHRAFDLILAGQKLSEAALSYGAELHR